MKLIFISITVVLLIIGAVYLFSDNNRLSSLENAYLSQTAPRPQGQETASSGEVEVIAENLEIPWAIAFLPDESMLVTERLGRLRKVSPAGEVTTVAEIEGVRHIGEGGLLGITLHPNFVVNNWVYLYHTYAANGNNTLNRVVRYAYEDDTLRDRVVIVDQIPGARNHNGGRILFGPDDYLYITTGDASEPSLSQDKDSLAGKILRVTEDGEPAPGNPFGNEVYSYGHRNPQGLAWREGELWITEHGPSAQDELNRVQIGENYGWPQITGTQERSGMQPPVIQSGSTTWAPAGLVYHNDRFYFVGLRGSALYSFDPQDPGAGVTEQMRGEFGRLREVVRGPDGALYLTTSNRDGRGSPTQSDDRIIRVP
jgi:glucose/arabinose dehydrogenase